MGTLQQSIAIYGKAAQLVNYLQPIYLISTRFYIAWIFFVAGLTKAKDWDAAVEVYRTQYSIPAIGHDIVALLITIAELLLPILLVVGAVTRLAVLGLMAITVVALIYMNNMDSATYTTHILWGVLLIHVFIFGPGSLSMDHYIRHSLALENDR